MSNYSSKLSYSMCRYYKYGKCVKKSPKEKLKNRKCIRSVDCLDLDPKNFGLGC